MTPESAPPIRAVMFDFHATLVDGGSPLRWVKSALVRLGRTGTVGSGLDLQELQALCDHLLHIWDHAHTIDPLSERDLSHLRHEEVFLQAAGVLPSIDENFAHALYDTMVEQWTPYHDTVPVLRELDRAGLPVLVLSNIGIDIRPALDRMGISEVVRAVVMSYEVGFVKPQPEIFEHALALLDVPAEETLMVGDSWHTDGGAAEVGIRTLILPRTHGPSHGLEAVLRLVGS